jgi:hypothetical protein
MGIAIELTCSHGSPLLLGCAWDDPSPGWYLWREQVMRLVVDDVHTVSLSCAGPLPHRHVRGDHSGISACQLLMFSPRDSPPPWAA